MRIGVPKEIKVHEYRVGLTPASVAELVAHGHELFVETKAGNGIDCPDAAYTKAGATILPDTNFTLSGNVGFYQGAQALALNAAAKVGPNVYVTGAFGGGLNKSGKVGGRVGFVFGW